MITNEEAVKHIKKLRDDFILEMKKKYEDAKVEIGLSDLPECLIRKKFAYSHDFEVQKMSEDQEGDSVIHHHMKILNDFQIEIEQIREKEFVVKDFTYIYSSIDTDYGDDDGEIDRYQICYEYCTLIEIFDEGIIGSHAKTHISEYLKNLLFEGVEASYAQSVSCADVEAILSGAVTVSTLRKIKYGICNANEQ